MAKLERVSRLIPSLLVGSSWLCPGPTWAANHPSLPTPPQLVLVSSNASFGRFAKIDFRVQVDRTYTNPFEPEEVDLTVQFTRPGAAPMTVPAFWAQPYERQVLDSSGRPRDWLYPLGQPHWHARFAPSEPGPYQAVAVLADRFGTRRSDPVTFTCVASPARGFVRVSRQDPRFLELSTGEPFFPIGQNLAFIGSGQYVTLAKAESIFAQLAAHGANYLRLWTCCEDWALAIEARKSAWGRSWDWRPPLVPMPDPPQPGLQCLTLTPARPTLEVNPSHPVALRPTTGYQFTAQIRTEPGATVRLDVGGTVVEPPHAGDHLAWRPLRHNFVTAPDQRWLPTLRFRLAGEGAAWIGPVSLRETDGGPELLWETDVNRPRRGFYNPVDCFMLDELLGAAEQHGIYLQLCLLTRDLYMDALKDPASPEYNRAIADAQRGLRYAVARWGHSPFVAAWEYWNEMNPNLPTDRFYTELGEFLERIDPYRHLRSTSTWGPSPKDCQHPKLDLADTHFYLRPTDRGRLDDEVHAILDRTRWLRDQAPAKPAFLGEFGLADDRWRLTDEMRRSRSLVDVHHALWASALSGASATALAWWWERLDDRNVYPLYRPLSRFIADVPWTEGRLEPASVTLDADRFRAVGLRAGDRVWLWLFDRAAAWSRVVTEGHPPTEVHDAHARLAGLSAVNFRVQWWHTREDRLIRSESLSATNGSLDLIAPPFTADVACKVAPGGQE
ncbi:MAG: DUF5060 domain-containing protein [Verrucomicrobia bacterium]|nr:DUF5060 domain-containing protein [Verrucomicrobiota bacterium]